MKRSTPNYLSRVVEAASITAPAARPPAMASPALPDTLSRESFPLELHDTQPPIQRPPEPAHESIGLPQRTQHASPHPVIPITPAGTLVARRIRDRHSAAKTTGGGTEVLPRSNQTSAPPAIPAADSHNSKPATTTTSLATKGTHQSGRAQEMLLAPPVKSRVSGEEPPQEAPVKRPLPSSVDAKVRDKVETETAISLSVVEVPSGAGIPPSSNEQSERFERSRTAFLEQRRAPVQEKKISADLPSRSEAKTGAVWPAPAANIPAPRLNPVQNDDNRVTIGAIEVQVNNHPAPVARPAAPSKAVPSLSDALETRYLNRFQLKL